MSNSFNSSLDWSSLNFPDNEFIHVGYAIKSTIPKGIKIDHSVIKSNVNVNEECNNSFPFLSNDAVISKPEKCKDSKYKRYRKKSDRDRTSPNFNNKHVVYKDGNITTEIIDVRTRDLQFYNISSDETSIMKPDSKFDCNFDRRINKLRKFKDKEVNKSIHYKCKVQRTNKNKTSGVKKKLRDNRYNKNNKKAVEIVDNTPTEDVGNEVPAKYVILQRQKEKEKPAQIVYKSTSHKPYIQPVFNLYNINTWNHNYRYTVFHQHTNIYSPGNINPDDIW
eukprot:TRINITY_DN7907_c0_g1_i1.p1 TRINITY_DN7907_c0_g1~~TRINITY_DN7907_c0_g1_i1.p1  ORF type:complete len:278 (-),score=18.20 TRINITY_DN7907_c0_g1_i1:527-1360(-)